jgi:DNA sulfur modification protein DndD
VKEAIEMVLGIRELIFAREDLEVITRDLKRELDALLVKQSDYRQEALEVEALGKEITDLRTNIGELEKRIEQAEANIKSCDETLGKNKALQDKIEQRKQAELTRKSIIEQMRTNEDKMRELNQHLAVILIAPLLQELSKATRATIEHWKKNAIAVLIQSDLCICDRPIDETIRRKFERQLDRDQGTSVRHYLGDQATELLLSAEPSAREKELSDMLTLHIGLRSNLTLTEQTIADLTKEIGIRKDLGLDIQAASDTRNRATEDLKRYQEELGAKKALLDMKSAEHKRRQQKLADQSADKEVKNKIDCIKSAEECEAGIKEAIDKIVEKSKSRVAQLASEVFLKLTNAPALYQGIEITADEYELRIKTVGGVVRAVWEQMPSAGQSQIIATSFIAALNRYSAREAPVVIDTPVGRLDPIHKSNLIKFYPELGPQVIILYQPNELTSEDIAPISKYVSTEWIFERDPHNPDATIIRRV